MVLEAGQSKVGVAPGEALCHVISAWKAGARSVSVHKCMGSHMCMWDVLNLMSLQSHDNDPTPDQTPGCSQPPDITWDTWCEVGTW